ncbi:MAG TPA: 4-alpha-glucanotransferase, partial [Candidatus Norongarragalinales archaeon]|nr:4-alpha-glucanotransferase [Candidatus Norongarragalinales archaeon]
RPYDADSGFALDPMYLSLDHLHYFDRKRFQIGMKALKRKFPAGGKYVNYEVKAAKLELLWQIFKARPKRKSSDFERYVRSNEFWLTDYALFKVIKKENGEKNWEEWPSRLKDRNTQALHVFEESRKEKVLFHKWLQWQLFRQFKHVKAYAQSKKVFFMGDLPFLASRDSADVWAHQAYFKLQFSSGAPPDAYFANGQRWGMPPCHWERMEERSFDYLIERLRYAENFYDLLRIDHVVGFFRLWSIPVTEPLANGGMNGFFDPSEENIWEDHGRKLLSALVQNTNMLVTAEDLGTVPDCSYRVLEAFGVCGMDVQRWTRDWKKTFAFKAPEDYR